MPQKNGRKVVVTDMGDKRKMHAERKKENLEKNLPELFGAAASANNIFAQVSFLLRLYGFYESVADGERSLEGETAEIWDTVCHTVKENFSDGFDGEKREMAVRTLIGLRHAITAKMQVLTAYTDRFSIYEYMLNRVELRFEDNLACPEDDTAAREILQYIFMEKDNLLINVRIQQMLSQFPVRMSRGKFEDLVRAGFENYAGMDAASVDEFVYRIESAAGLYEPEGMEEYFPQLAESLAKMQKTEWKTMGEEEYQSTQELFLRTTKELAEITDQYYSLMELVNPLCAWLLNYPYASAESAARTEVFMPLLNEICGKALAKDFSPIPEDLEARMAETEGVLEELGPKLQQLQGIFSDFDAETEKIAEALMLEKQLAGIRSSALLLGNSLFAELDVKNSQKTADRTCLKEASDTLVNKLMAALCAQQTMQNRAMIAAVLSQLPVFFNSQKEVMDYVRASLASCHETAEKVAGIRLMKELMEA